VSEQTADCSGRRQSRCGLPVFACAVGRDGDLGVESFPAVHDRSAKSYV